MLLVAAPHELWWRVINPALQRLIPNRHLLLHLRLLLLHLRLTIVLAIPASARNAGTALTAAHSTAVLHRSSTADRSCTASSLRPLLLLRLLHSKLFLLLSPLLVFLLLSLRKLLERLLLILRQIIPPLTCERSYPPPPCPAPLVSSSSPSTL